MAKVSETPVLIVGAGAAGTTLGLELARQGVEARMVDRLPEPSPFSKAITIHARTLELLENVDPALAARFLDTGMRSPGYVMHYLNEQGERREVRPGLDYTGLPCRYPFLLTHGQNVTEGTLRDYLRERWGREPEWGVTCTAVEQRGDGVDATLEHASGGVERVRCRFVAACDGGNSRIRRQLGLAQEGSDYAGTVLQNLDIELVDFPDRDEWMHYCMGPAHFLMAAKLPAGYFRLLMSQPAERADTEATPHEVFGEVLGRHFDGVRFGRTVWHSRWGSVVRLAHSYREGDVFLAGDAAHLHSTAGGQGLNCCMQDAFNLGWKLGMVLKGQAAEALLDTYESERKPIGKQVIDAASLIHELFMTGRNEGPEALEALRHSGFLDDLVQRVSGIAYHYRGEDHAGGDMLRAGDRLPNLPLEGGAEAGRLYDLTRHEGPTLLAALEGDRPEEELRAQMDAIAGRYPGVLRLSVLPRAPAALLPDGAAVRLYLVRPDAYLAAACDPGSPAPLRDWLETHLVHEAVPAAASALASSGGPS